MEPGGKGIAVVVARDLLLSARLESAARAAGLQVRAAPTPSDEPVVVLADLDGIDGLDELRARWPHARIVGFLSHVDAERRARAESLGIEVHPRGASVDAAGIIRGAR